LTKWVEQGGDSFIKASNTQTRETLMQKMLKDNFEKFLYKRGIRASDVRVIREPQKTDDERLDFLITYGTGCIMIELKRGYNPDINDTHAEDYRKNKFLPYMKSHDCSHGILLVMRDDENKPKDFAQLIQMNQSVYESDLNIEVIGIDCIKNIKVKPKTTAKKRGTS
jgi:hypothetical protein